jgi:hypothetical protein
MTFGINAPFLGHRQIPCVEAQMIDFACDQCNARQVKLSAEHVKLCKAALGRAPQPPFEPGDHLSQLLNFK